MKRQPETPSELVQMTTAVACADFDCIRYRGLDPAVQKQMSLDGLLRLCDSPLPEIQQK